MNLNVGSACFDRMSTTAELAGAIPLSYEERAKETSFHFFMFKFVKAYELLALLGTTPMRA